MFARESLQTVGTFVGRPALEEEEPRPQDRQEKASTDDEPRQDEAWSLDDLVEQQPRTKNTWPSAEDRTEAAARGESLRLAMTEHADHGWMMFPAIADDGSFLPAPGDGQEHEHNHHDVHE